ncbi:MAG: DUF2993 domain-containing protein [Gordonia sp. (in: high G+C Gram-positive bacteria)]|uniref:LmeA family phospholipid-binding protein n=1 Tax=Gordonia sp. (in: high G+C Gram-positive bacteria) TaxID=84139 RepID=UPI0039E3D9BE
MTSSTRIADVTRIRRPLAVTVAVVASMLVVALLTDLVTASRAESRLAHAVQASPSVTYEPEVMLNGFPFLTRAGRGDFPMIHLSARGVTAPGCADRGRCTVDVDARLYDAELGDVWSTTPSSPIRFQRLEAQTRVDSVNLGRLMNIVDLYINTPAPEGRIGGGGPGDGLLERTEGIMLSGTVPLPGSPARDGKYPPSASEYRHPKVKVSVSARVSVVDGRVRIDAVDLYTGPEEHFSDDVPEEFRSHVFKLFSITLPPLPTAWDTPVTSALSRGSDLVLIGERPGGTVEPRAF